MEQVATRQGRIVMLYNIECLQLKLDVSVDADGVNV